jgi:hypothetical protein
VKARADSNRWVCRQFALYCDQIGIHDDFFELGGTSFLGATVVARVRACAGADLPFGSFFEAPMVVRMAVQLKALRLPHLTNAQAIRVEQSRARLESGMVAGAETRRPYSVSERD